MPARRFGGSWWQTSKPARTRTSIDHFGALKTELTSGEITDILPLFINAL